MTRSRVRIGTGYWLSIIGDDRGLVFAGRGSIQGDAFHRLGKWAVNTRLDPIQLRYLYPVITGADAGTVLARLLSAFGFEAWESSPQLQLEKV